MKDRQKRTRYPAGVITPCHKSGNEEINNNLKGLDEETLIQIIQTQNITIESLKICNDTLTEMLNHCGLYTEKLQKCSDRLQVLKVVR